MKSMRGIIEATKNPGWFWDTEVVLRAEAAQKKLYAIPGVFIRRPEKKSTVRIIPDTIAYLKAISKFKKEKN